MSGCDRPMLLAPATRRTAVAGALATAAAALSMPALAQRSRGPAEVPVEELMRSDLPDITIGKADAPVTIVEYASMSCGHCATFHKNVYPQLKSKYIDAGTARLIFREYPLDRLSAVVSMSVRCASADRQGELIAEMFTRQNDWADLQGAAAIRKLQELVQPFGLTEQAFNACVGDKQLLTQIEASRKRARERFGVSATPTFFVNGRRLASHALADFDKAIEPILKK